MNLKVPGAILLFGCAIMSTRAKTVGGLLQYPLRRTRVKGAELKIEVCFVIKNKERKIKKNKSRKEKENQKISTRFVISTNNLIIWSYSTKVCVRLLKGSRMSHSDKVSLWCVTLLINIRFPISILE